MTVPQDPYKYPTEDQNSMSCEEFQALLPELIGTGEDINLHPHIQTCELCRAFLADLEAIAEAARQLFPIVEPPDELWSQIDARIREEGTGSGNGSDLTSPRLAAAGEGEAPA